MGSLGYLRLWPVLALIAACAAPVSTPLQGQTRLEFESIAFPGTRLGAEAAETLLIYNESNAPVHILAIESLDSAFEVLGPTGAIAPGDSAQLRLRFRPVVRGRVSTVVALTMSNEDLLGLKLSGTGQQLRLSVQPEYLDFGPTVIETTSRRSLTVLSDGTEPFDIELTGSNSIQYCDDTPQWATFCVHRVPITNDGQPAEIRAEFNPVNIGSGQRAQLVLGACPDCAQAIFEGDGIVSGMTCGPDELDFGDTSPGQCASRSILCDNVGNQRVIANLSIAGDLSFRFEGGESMAVPPYAQRSIEIRFCPTERGEALGRLTIDTDQSAPGERMQTNLRGRGGGPQLIVTPTMLDFGRVPIESPTRLPIQLSNPGDRPLRVSTSTTSNGPISASGESEIEPSEEVIWWVEARPDTPGAWGARLTLATNTPSGTTDISVRGVAESQPACSYDLPPSLELGSTTPSMPSAGLLRFTNTGTNPCFIHRLEFTPQSSTALRLLHPPRMPLRVPGQQTVILDIEMLGDIVGPVEGTLEFTANNPSQPYTQVSIRGQIASEGLIVAPPVLNFGVLAPTCTNQSRALRLYSTLAEPRMITSLQVSGPDFSMISGPDLSEGPYSMGFGERVDIDVGFSPRSNGHSTGSLIVASERGGVLTEQRIPLHGDGAATPWAIESFVQLDRKMVDLLFVIDFSGCMSREQAGVARNFHALTRIMQTEQLNYHVGVTTTDTDDEAGRLMHPDRVRGNAFGGPYENRIMHAGSQPDPAAVFEIAMQARNLTGGSARDESPFGAAYLAMQPELLNAHNSGFLRRDAHLSVLFMADEPEQTMAWNGGPPTRDLGFYLDFFRAMKGIDGKSDFRAFSFAGDSPDGCTGDGGNADPAPRLAAIAQDSGGVFSTICTSDWQAALDDLAAPLAGAGSTFFLAQTPDLATLQVEIMGTLIPPHAYQYRAADHALTFVEAFIPEPGDLLTVAYVPACP